MKNIKFITLMLAFGIFVNLFMTSCEKESLEIQETREFVDNSPSEANSTTVKVVFNQSIAGLSDTEKKAIYKEASIGERLQFQKNYIICNMYRELNIVTDENANEWSQKSLDEVLNFHNFLTDTQIENLEAQFKNIVLADLRANCNWRRVLIYEHPFPNGADIYHYQYLCSSNTVVLWKDNGGNGAIVGVIDADQNIFINFTQNNCCPNDDARSMEMFNMVQGQKVTVYDDSQGRWWEDDWCSVTVNANFESRLISSFEINTSNSSYTQVYQNGGNLDGKVSSIRIEGN